MTRPSGRRPSRPVAGREQRRIVKVLCEGAITEPQYLSQITRRYRGVVRVDIEDSVAGCAPLSLVAHAKAMLAENKRARRKTGTDNFDEIWCVFDVDEHPNLAQAKQEAADVGIQVAVSNPCFELWLLLHTCDQTAYIERKDLQKTCRDAGLIQGKHVSTDLIDQLDQARTRAVYLETKHQQDNSPEDSNPSTGVWRLTDRITGATD